MNKNTEKKVKRLLVQNKNGKNDVELYVWHLEYFTETLVREMRDYINFDELFDRRRSTGHCNFFSKDFYNEIKNEKNFGKYMATEAGLDRMVRSGDIVRLDSRLALEFKNEILDYAKSVGEEEDYQYYMNLFESKKEYYAIKSMFHKGEIDAETEKEMLKGIGVQFKKIKIGKIEIEQEIK